MQKLTIAAIALLGLTSAALGQGAVNLDNSLSTYGVAVDSAGSYYSGTYGVELWLLNGTTVPAGINSAGNVAAHNLLSTSGLSLVRTWSGQTMSTTFRGTLGLGEVDMAGVTPPGSSVVLAFAVWTGNYTNWAAAAAAGAKGALLPL